MIKMQPNPRGWHVSDEPSLSDHRYSDSQNYVYSNKFFLSRPFLQWKKRGKNLEKFIGVEQASEHKKINFVQCKIKNF